MIQRRTPIRRVSKKRAKESRIYLRKRKAFLLAHPICQVWLYELAEPLSNILSEIEINVPRKFLATDVHHTAGRDGGNYLNESTWLAVCRQNHERIHNNPSWARAHGFLK